MRAAETETLVKIENVLYLTDFSETSEAALPYAMAVARKYAGKVEALHVLAPAIPESCPQAVKADEELAEQEMRKIEAGPELQKKRTVEDSSVWAGVERAIKENQIDLIVLGTHGRSGASRLVLGSEAEEIFRRSPVPVLTVGPEAAREASRDIRFERVLLADDFSRESEAAAAYATYLAQGINTQLFLLHVMPEAGGGDEEEQKRFEGAVTEAINKLYRAVANHALGNPAEVLIQYGDPAKRILRAAQEQKADVIVLGARGAEGHLGAATHIARAVAHQVVRGAHCPVITVPGEGGLGEARKGDSDDIRRPSHCQARTR